MLRLAACPAMMQDQCSRSVAGFFWSNIALHKAERHVEARGHPGGCPHLTISDKNPVDFNGNLWKTAL
jgi:hypothetical protein